MTRFGADKEASVGMICLKVLPTDRERLSEKGVKLEESRHKSQR